MLHDKVLIAATCGEDAFRSAMLALSTAAEVLSANNEMIHALRKSVGEAHCPIRVSTNLTKIGDGINQLTSVCKAKRRVLFNLTELSSIAQKVTAMATYIDEEIEIGDNDYKYGSGVDDEPVPDDTTPIARNEEAKAPKRSSDTTPEMAGGRTKRRIHERGGERAVHNDQHGNSEEEQQGSEFGPDVVFLSRDPLVYTSRSGGAV